MWTVIRSILAVIAGFVAASAVMMIVETANGRLLCGQASHSRRARQSGQGQRNGSWSDQCSGVSMAHVMDSSRAIRDALHLLDF